MLKKRNALLILIFLPFIIQGQQDYHFSQFFASPITYNPATAGAFNADIRGALTYRNQYTSVSEGYRTFAFAADAPIKLTNKSFDQNFLGAGISLVNDNAGIAGFNNFQISGNVAYAIDLGGTDQNPHFISVGLQFGYMQRSIDLSKVSWETQWTGTGFNQGLASGEPVSGAINESNIDLGGGVAWYNSINEQVKLLAGASVLHANTPTVDLLGSNESLQRKYIGHVSMAIYPENSSVTYLPNLFVMFQGPNRIIDVGSEIEFTLWERTEKTTHKNNLSTNLGAYYRLQDAIYFIGRVNYYDFSLGLSYDFTASKLNQANNGRGGVELVLSYRTRFSGPGYERQKLIRSKGL